MDWTINTDRPVYIQLMEHIQHSILSGQYKPGEKLPSVRELALEAGVNPNTMQKALSELEREGVVYSKRTSGRFVTEDQGMLMKIKKDQADSYIKGMLDYLKQMGLTKQEIKSFVETMIEEA